MTNYLMKVLEEKGVPTHFVEELDDRRTVVKRVSIIPLEVIIRNKAAGSFSKRLGIPEGTIHTWLKAVRSGTLDIGEGYHTPSSEMSLAEEIIMLRKRV